MNQSLRVMSVTLSTILLLFLLLFLTLLIFLGQVVHSQPIPFDNDEANHALDGWNVYHALQAGSPAAVFDAIRRQSFYPPLHSLMLAVAYHLDEPGLAASRWPGVLSLALLFPALGALIVALARRQAPPQSRAEVWVLVFGAAFTMALAASGPVLITNAVLCMLELPGALLAVGVLWLAHITEFGSTERPYRRSGLLLLGGLLAALFLTKYTFGLFYAPALLAAMLTPTWPWRLPRSVWLAALRPQAVLAVLLAAWLSITDPAGVWRFFTDHPAYVDRWSAENLLYLPRLWLEGYNAGPVLAIPAIILAALGVWRYRACLSVRLAAWAVLAATLALTISTTNEPRHWLVVMPALWLLVGLGLVFVLGLVFAAGQRPYQLSLLAALLVLLWSSQLGPRLPAWPAALQAELEGEPVFTTLQRNILQRVDPAQPILLLGDWHDQNNLLAFRWLAAVESGRSTQDLVIDYHPFDRHRHALARTSRKAQAPDLDPALPQDPLAAVFAHDTYAWAAEVRYFGPGLEDAPLPPCPHVAFCGQPYDYAWFEGWLLIVYNLRAPAGFGP